MADILEFPSLDVSGLHRQAGCCAFQRLDAGHLVDRDGPHALFGSGWRGLIDRAKPATGRLSRWAHLASKSGSGLGVSQ